MLCRVVTCLALLVPLGCGDSGLTLKVLLVTDYRAGTELAMVETALEVGGELRVVRTPALASDMLIDGKEVASFDGLASGSHRVEVRAFDPTGAALAMRASTVMMTDDLTVTVLLTRDCAAVECPGPTDSATATECQGGRCVEPGCGPDHPELCPTPDCTMDGDCVSSIACARGRCLGGSCFFEANDAACGASEVCQLGRGGCVAATVDSGPTPDGGGVTSDGGPISDRDGGPVGVDGGMPGCPPGCPCAMMCDFSGLGSPPCICNGSCSCSFSCGVGTCRPECTDSSDCEVTANRSTVMTCDRGSTCRVTADAGDDVRVDCLDGATCDVTCGAGASCTLTCDSRMASCIIHCDPAAAECRISRCRTPSMMCPGNVRVCQTPCP